MLDRADFLLEEYPDSALAILNRRDISSFGSESQKARFALLKSAALDKTGKNVTQDSLADIAYSYYSGKGDPLQKAMSAFYRGRISQNQGNLKEAYLRMLEAYDLA